MVSDAVMGKPMRMVATWATSRRLGLVQNSESVRQWLALPPRFVYVRHGGS